MKNTLYNTAPRKIILLRIIFILILINSGCLSMFAQQLEYSDYFKQGDSIKGIDNPSFITTDLFGRSVYIASTQQNTLAHYTRDITTGELAFAQLLKDGMNGIDGLNGLRSMAISSDRKNLYAAGSTDFSIAVFARNTLTGQLTFLEVKKDNTGDVGDLGLPFDLSITSDGRHCYVGSTSGLILFNRDLTTGALIYEATFLRSGSLAPFYPSSIEISPDDRHIYATNLGDSSITVFHRDEPTGIPTVAAIYKNKTAGITGMTQPGNIAIDPAEAKNIYVTSTRDSTILVFNRDETTGILALTEILKQNVNGVDGLITTTSLTIDSQGKNIYTSCSKDSSVSVFNRDQATGTLTYAGSFRQWQNGVDGIRGCGFAIPAKDGNHVYAAGNTGNTIAVFNRDLSTGMLSYHNKIESGVIGNKGLANPTLIVSDRIFNKNVYVASSSRNTLAVYSRNSATGALTYQQIFKDNENGVNGLSNIGSMIVSPNRKNIYVSGRLDFAIAVFNRNSSTGLLTFQQVKIDGIDDVLRLGYVFGMHVTSDGKFLYAACTDGLVVFSIDAITGGLTYNNFYDRGIINDAFIPTSITISQDDKFLYLGSLTDSSLTVFSRDETSGTATMIAMYKNKTSGIVGMTQPANILIDPSDGKRLYLSSSKDSSILYFKRDEATGLLTFSELYKNGVNNIKGLVVINSMTMDPEGKNIYTTCSKDSSVSVFNRDASTGKLSYSGTFSQGSEGIMGLGGSHYALISDDGKHLYAAGYTSNALTVFNILSPPLAPKNLAATANGDQIDLTWDANSESELVSYSIYRNTVNDYSSATLLETANESSTALSDETAAVEVTYYYWIKANNSAGHYSWFSLSDSSIIKSITGVVKNELIKYIMVYPNPSSDYFNIHLTNNKSAEVEITHVQGSKTKNMILENGRGLLDLSELPSGVYIAKISCEGTTVNIKLIKK